MLRGAHEADRLTGVGGVPDYLGIYVVEATRRAAMQEREEQEQRIHVSQQLLTPVIAAASRTTTEIDVVSLVADMSGIAAGEVNRGLERLRTGGIIVPAISDETDAKRARWQINTASSIAMDAAYRVSHIDVGGEWLIPRHELIGVVAATDEWNQRPTASADEQNYRLTGFRSVYFPELPMLADAIPLPVSQGAVAALARQPPLRPGYVLTTSSA